MSWLTHIVTESDNQTVCPVRIIYFAGVVFYHLFLAVASVTGFLHLDIDTLGQYVKHIVEFGGAAGASIGAKSLMKGDAQ